MLKYMRDVNYSKVFSQVFTWIGKNPRKSVAVGLLLFSPLIDRRLKIKAASELELPVYEKLLKGSKPKVPLDTITQVIPRPHIANDIERLFFPKEGIDKTNAPFGIIIGPSGSGKTTAVTALCNRFWEGVLYYEIDEPNSFVSDLSREIGMKIAPITFLDLILGYVSQKYTHYYELPECQLSGIKMVLNILNETAKRYIREKKKISVLFLDGVDVLAKHDPNLFTTLITLAKVLANNNELKIVFISSEGTVMSLLEDLSATNRAIIYEVGDVNDEEGIEYLMKNGIDENLAKKLINCIGGRMVYLANSIYLAKREERNETSDAYNKIEDVLFSRLLNSQSLFIEMTKPESIEILKKMSTKGYVVPVELISGATDQTNMKKVLIGMIRANILRFNGKVQEMKFGKGVPELGKGIPEFGKGVPENIKNHIMYAL